MMDIEQASNTRFDGTVAMWFSTHYQIDPREWDTIQELNGPYHPAAGYYRSDDPQILKRQLREMRRAGVDLIVYDAFASLALPLTDFTKDRALAMLVEELAHQQHEARKLQLAIYIEKYDSYPSAEEYEAALTYIRDNLANREFYFKYQGKPLVTSYLDEYPEHLDEIEWRNDDFTMRRIRPYQSDVWSYIHPYPQPLRKDWMVVSPGYDSFMENAYLARMAGDADLAQIRKEASKADREDGAFFERQLLRARMGNPEIIFISGWNDWQYGNHIEPAEEYGYKYVDLAARLLGRQQETSIYRDEAK
ncbi:glycoside hydrolase family 99-like domain-containing protein [Candidatus Sumerlaeota bacterium]